MCVQDAEHVFKVISYVKYETQIFSGPEFITGRWSVGRWSVRLVGGRLIGGR